MIEAALPIVGGVIQQWGAEKQNAQALMRQREVMAWEERMSGSAYQRSVADMRAAGLNPAMMFGHGAAASTPAVTPAPVVNAKQGLGQSVADSVRLLNETRLASAQAAKTESETAVNKVLLGLRGAETDNARAQAGEIAARIKELGSRSALNDTTARSVQADLPRKEALNVALNELVTVLKNAIGETKRTDGKAPYEVPIQKALDAILGDPDKRAEENAKKLRESLKRPGRSTGYRIPRNGRDDW